MMIKEVTEVIETLKAEIAEMQVQVKRVGEDREKEKQVPVGPPPHQGSKSTRTMQPRG